MATKYLFACVKRYHANFFFFFLAVSFLKADSSNSPFCCNILLSFLKVFCLPLSLSFLPPPRRLCFHLGLFVSLFVCKKDNSKTYGQILMKFSGYV